MTIPDSLARAITTTLGSPVAKLTTVSGGDINDAYRAALEDGRRVFVKTHHAAPPGMYTAEAWGLRWLAGSHGLHIPEVLAACEAEGDLPALLALAWVEQGRPASDHDERLGRGLAALHRQGASRYGADADNFIGSLPQVNTPMESWVDFYREARLEAQLQMAVHQGRAGRALREGFERLYGRLDNLIGEPEEGPSRLHGDLWGGNAMRDERGRPCLIDPAVYGGDREVDLAMMRLFGGFSDTTFAAYQEAYPLRAGAQDRIALYQLYPLMVHVNLFGGHYGHQVQAILDRF